MIVLLHVMNVLMAANDTLIFVLTRLQMVVKLGCLQDFDL